METIKELLDRIIEDAVLTAEEHEEFIARINEDGEIDEEESQQLVRLFDLIREGKLRVVR